MPPVLGRAHDNNHIGRTRFFARTLAADTHGKSTEISENKDRQDQDRKKGRAPGVRYSYLNIVRGPRFFKGNNVKD